MLFLLSDFLVDSLFLRKVMKTKSPNSVTTFMSGQCCVRGSEGDPRLILDWDCSDRPVSRGGGALTSHQCSDHPCTLGICRDGGGHLGRKILRPFWPSLRLYFIFSLKAQIPLVQCWGRLGWDRWRWPLQVSRGQAWLGMVSGSGSITVSVAPGLQSPGVMCHSQGIQMQILPSTGTSATGGETFCQCEVEWELFTLLSLCFVA